MKEGTGRRGYEGGYLDSGKVKGVKCYKLEWRGSWEGAIPYCLNLGFK